jgi:hypothetical protein
MPSSLPIMTKSKRGKPGYPERSFMKQFCYCILLLCLGSGMDSGASAQSGSLRLVTGSYQNMSAGDWLDSLHITLSAVGEPLDSVLKKAFAKTSFSFSFDQQQDIFITRGRPLATNLPPGFFEGKLIPAEQNRDLTDFLNDTTKPVISTLENKLYVIGTKNSKTSPDRISVAGYIRDIETGEPVRPSILNIRGSG